MGKSRADTVYQQTELRLSRLVSGDEGTVRGRLANLRRGAGRIPGDEAEGGDDDARERVARRFHQIVLAQDMPALTYYLRTFIQLLRSAEIGLDYALLAKDLFLYQWQDQVSSVRLQWGQDFYRKNKSNE